MRKSCNKAVYLLMLFVISSCALSEKYDKNLEEYSTIERAEGYFEEEVIRLLSDRIEGEQFFFGNIIPNWKSARTGSNYDNGRYNVEVDIMTQYRYRVRQRYPGSNRCRIMPCRQELLVSEDMSTGDHGVFIIMYIASNEFDKSHRANVYKKLDNNGNMEDFSGLKVYCTIDGRVVRVNKYKKGIKIQGNYLLTSSPKINDSLFAWFKGIEIQRGCLRMRSKSDSESELDPSYCYGDYPYFPFDDPNFWSWMWQSGNDYGYYDPDDGNVGNYGSGGGGGYTGGPSADTRTKTVVGYVVGSDKEKVKKFVDILSQYQKTYPLINKIFSKINEEKVCLLLVSTDSYLHYMTRRPDSSGKIYVFVPLANVNVNSPEFLYPNHFLEEVFHVFQYQHSLNWKTGDLEFEAKIWDQYLYIEYGLFLGNSFPNIYEYYKNPSAANFDKAVTELRMMGYSESDFPMELSGDSLFKHIKLILE